MKLLLSIAATCILILSTAAFTAWLIDGKQCSILTIVGNKINALAK